MRYLLIMGMALFAISAEARVDYTYVGAGTLDQVVDLEGGTIGQLLSATGVYGEVQEVGTLFILTQPPWGCLESHIPTIQDGDLKVTLEGKGMFYDGTTPSVFQITPELIAEVVPYVIIGGTKYFLNTDKPGYLNQQQMQLVMHPEGNNYRLDLTQVQQADFTLLVITEGQGTVAVDPNKATYAFGERVVLTATPDPGWNFDGWEVSLTAMSKAILPTLTLVMTDDFTVIAHFSQINVPGVNDADINGDNKVNAMDVQLVINAALGKSG